MANQELISLRVLPNRIVPSDRAVVEIYRPFFLAGVLTVLTAGCTLGAAALVGVASQASYTASAWTPYVLAHANSQLYGWVGFFIMGFALQQHAPSLSKERLFHRLAYASLMLMAIGIGLRFAAEPLTAANLDLWRPIGYVSCALQFIGVLLFLINTGATRHRSGGKLTWPTTLVFASLFWLLLVAAAEPFFFHLSHQPDRAAGIMFVAQWFPPYRDAQFLGFVTMMIFGVALTKMNTCFGAQPAIPNLGLTGFVLWNVGLVTRQWGWLNYFRSGMDPDHMNAYVAGGYLLAVAAGLLVISSRMYDRLERHMASHKFIKAAFAWLLIAGALFLFEPAHLKAIGQPFSHAYIGAMRHALTVGFISQMILGVGMHVVATMNDLPVQLEKPLWATFWLINIGNGLRVFLELASDYTPGAFKVMGVTGFIELAGLLLWASYVAGLMRGPRVLNAA